MHRASLWSIILLSGLVVQTAAQQAVLMNRATLRVDPSSKNPPTLRLDAGTDVDLIDPSPSHSYYPVRTADGQEGWIYSQTLKLVSAIPPPTTPPTPTSPGTPLLAPAGVSTLFSPDWEKPAPNQTTFTGPDGECGPTGDGCDTSTNARKNRTDVPASYHEVTWKALQSLTYPLHAPRSLEQWPPHQIRVIQPSEGVPVSTVGYIATIKVEDTGSGESTNCHFANPKEVDWHVPLVEHAGDAEASAIVVETTPPGQARPPKMDGYESFSVGEFKFSGSHQWLDSVRSRAWRTGWTIPINALGNPSDYNDRGLYGWALGECRRSALKCEQWLRFWSRPSGQT